MLSTTCAAHVRSQESAQDTGALGRRLGVDQSVGLCLPLAWSALSDPSSDGVEKRSARAVRVFECASRLNVFEILLRVGHSPQLPKHSFRLSFALTFTCCEGKGKWGNTALGVHGGKERGGEAPTLEENSTETHIQRRTGATLRLSTPSDEGSLSVRTPM